MDIRVFGGMEHLILQKYVHWMGQIIETSSVMKFLVKLTMVQSASMSLHPIWCSVSALSKASPLTLGLMGQNIWMASFNGLVNIYFQPHL